MSAKHIALRIDEIAFSRSYSTSSEEILIIIVCIDKTDFLAVFSIGIDKSIIAGKFSHLFFIIDLI